MQTWWMSSFPILLIFLILFLIPIFRSSPDLNSGIGSDRPELIRKIPAFSDLPAK